MLVGVLGAAGAVGRHTVQQLLERGHTVRVVGRRRETLAEVYGDRCDIVPGDLANPEDVKAAVQGLDAAVYTVGLPYTKADFARYPGMMDLAVDALREAGAKRLVHVSNVYPYGRPQTTPVTEDHPLEPCAVKGRHRKEQEDRVRAAHDPAGLQTIVLRPPDFYGPHALSIISFAFDGAVAGKKADLLGPADTPHEFVFVPDLARVIATLLDRDDGWGEAYNVPTAGAITCREFAVKVYEAAGQKPRFRVAGPFLQRILGLFMPVMRELREMSYLLETPVLLDGTKLRQHLGDDQVITPYDDGIRQTLDHRRAST